jgi:hypothetical protein
MQLSVAVLSFTIGCFGCATVPASGLDDLRSKARYELYKNCMSVQMKTAPFGTSEYVHIMCRDFARNRVP